MQIADRYEIKDVYEYCWLAYQPTYESIREFGINTTSFNNRLVFDLFTHHVLHLICEDILRANADGKKIILFQNTKPPFDNTWDLDRAINRIIKIAERVIPTYWIKYLTFNEFTEAYRNNNLDAVQLVESVEAKFEKNAFKFFNLNKTIKYLEKRGMNYLGTDYFKQANTKLLTANK